MIDFRARDTSHQYNIPAINSFHFPLSYSLCIRYTIFFLVNREFFSPMIMCRRFLNGAEGRAQPTRIPCGVCAAEVGAVEEKTSTAAATADYLVNFHDPVTAHTSASSYRAPPTSNYFPIIKKKKKKMLVSTEKKKKTNSERARFFYCA